MSWFFGIFFAKPKYHLAYTSWHIHKHPGKPDLSNPLNYLRFLLVVTACLYLGCHSSENRQVKGQVESRLPAFTKDHVIGFAYIAEHLYKNYPPSEYLYVYTGQSPTPIYALFASIEDKLPQRPSQVAIPLSKASKIPKYILANPHGDIDRWIGGPDYFLKLVEHLDAYLMPTLLEEVFSENAPRKLLFIDYAASGDSLGATKQVIDYYLRYKSSTAGAYAKFLNVRTEYFAISNEADDMDILKARIDSAKTPYPSKVPNFIKFQGLIPEKNSLSTIVDMKERIQAINQNTKPENWHWKGEVFDLGNLPDKKPLVLSFTYQQFDYFSPYGSWDLRKDISGSKRELSYRFLQLVAAFKSCSMLE